MIFKYECPLYTHKSDLFSENGTNEVPEYILDFPERGGVCLKEIGIKPIYEIIQANISNCDLTNVIESCVHSNQYAVCNQENLNSIITDYVGLTDLGELFAASKRMERTWKELPLEVRESFGSDMKSFIREMGSDAFNEKITSGYDKFYRTISKTINPDIIPPDSGSTGSKVDDKEVNEKEMEV